MLISFLYLGFVLWKLHQANRLARGPASEQRWCKVQEARA
jgi:hypothetical protein